MKRSSPMLVRAGFVVLFVFATRSAVAGVGLVTVKDGNVWMLRGTGWYAVPVGIAVEDGDGYEVTDRSVAQLELESGTTVQAIGSATLYVPGIRDGNGTALPEIGLAAGWAKVVQGAGAVRVRSGQVGISFDNAVVVVHATRDGAEVFVESGRASVAVVDGKGAPRELKGGDFVAMAGAAPPSAAPRTRAVFVAEMPRALRDPLPALASHFKGPPPAPVLVGDVSFAEAQPWLAGPYRIEFMRRLSGRLADPAFREAAKPYLPQWPDWKRAAAASRVGAEKDH